MNRVYRLFDRADDGTDTGYVDQTGSVPVEGPEFNFQRNDDELGIAQVYIAGGTAKVQIEGRCRPVDPGESAPLPTDGMPWSVLESIDETDVDSTGTVVVPVRILPYMRVQLVSGTATSVRVFLVE